jgi:hypothetical protein
MIVASLIQGAGGQGFFSLYRELTPWVSPTHGVFSLEPRE